MLKSWKWGTYIFFSVFLAAAIVWVWWFLPETKGATLEEMDRVFNSQAGERDAVLLREAQQEVSMLTLKVEKGEKGHVEEVQMA
jgi:hypothetical protein